MTAVDHPWAGPLSAWLGARVTAVTRITGGFSRLMARVDLDGRDPVVVRVEQGGVFGTDTAGEARTMRALHAAGAPVAGLVAVDERGEVLGSPAMVMQWVPHDPGPPPEEAWRDAVRRLAELHQLSPPAELDRNDPVERWHAVARRATPSPVPLLEEARAWLERWRPPPTVPAPATVHGDAGPGNFLHRHGQLVAFTDWEFTHAGDPAEDWVFWATMRGSSILPPEGWRTVFAEEAGVRFDDVTWRWWEACNLFKGACANLTAAQVVTGDPPPPSPELVIVGTALHQVFLRRLADLVARPPTGQTPAP